jgi:hypothetical protein
MIIFNKLMPSLLLKAYSNIKKQKADKIITQTHKTGKKRCRYLTKGYSTILTYSCHGRESKHYTINASYNNPVSGRGQKIIKAGTRVMGEGE